MEEKVAQSTKFSVQRVKITFILFKCHRSIDNSNHFYLFVKRLMKRKNPVVKFQDFTVNHESQPVKSNPKL